MTKELFLLVSNAIDDVPEVRWIDFDMGQLEQEFPPVSFPCALISFTSANYVDLGSGSQVGETVVSIRVAFKIFGRTHSKTAVPYRDEGLKHLDILDAINVKLSELSGDNVGTLSRSNWNTERRADLRVYGLNYTTQVYDTPESPYSPVTEHLPEGNQVGFCTDEIIIEA